MEKLSSAKEAVVGAMEHINISEPGTYLDALLTPKGVLALLAAILVPLALYRMMPRKKRDLGPKSDGPEAVIVGGGVVGATLATALARDGRKVMMIERDMSEQHRIVGELLQPGGMRALKQLGMDDCVEGIGGMRETGYVVYYEDQSVRLSYPEDDATHKPETGISFHFGPFVQNLRAAAKKEPNVQCVEAVVTDLIFSDDRKKVEGVQYRTKDGNVLQAKAPLTIVADGCTSKFRKSLVKNTPSVTSKFYGLIMEDAPLEYPGHAMVFLLKPYPVVSYQIDEHQTRVLVDVPAETNVEQAVEYMKETVAPQLPEFIRACFLKAVDPARMQSVPNYYLPAAPMDMAGALILGDALNIRHPTTGGGMTVAFKDIVMWRKLLSEVADWRDTDAVLAKLHEFKVYRKTKHSFVINVMSNALYSIFAADNDRLAVLKESCFDYFKMGGECSEGPMTLLAATHPSPIRLLRHFFSVAAYGMYRVTTANGVLLMPVNFIKSLMVLGSAWGVLVPLAWQELKYTHWE